MIKLKNLIETKFRNYKHHIHLIDVPMFSIYADATLDPQTLKNLQSENQLNYLKKQFEYARTEIHKIGFPSMKVNVVLKDLSQHTNYNTGDTGIGGYAHDGQYMAISIKGIMPTTIVHEWAHLWMHQHSKEFKEAVKKIYVELLKTASSKIDSKDFPATLGHETEMSVIKIWEKFFTDIIHYQLNKYPLNVLYLKKVGYDSSMTYFLPQGFTIHGILRKNITAQDFYGSSKYLPEGTEVYAEKGNSGWIVGINNMGVRYETVLHSTNEINVYLKPKDDSISLDDYIKAEFKKYSIKHGKNIVAAASEMIQSYAESHFKNICNSLHSPPTSEDIKTVRSWAKDYIFPALNDLLRSKKTIDNLRNSIISSTSINSIYGRLWVSNKYKPDGVSIVKLAKSVKQREDLVKFKRDLQSRNSLSGKEFTGHREIMMKLANWVNSYGMSNSDEFWATAIELFFYLPSNYKKLILSLM